MPNQFTRMARHDLNDNCYVYFDGEYAYSVPYSQVFTDDVFHQNMEPVDRKGKYVKDAKDGV